MYFTVDWAPGTTGPTTNQGAPHFDGSALVIDGTRYSEAQWRIITVISETPEGSGPKRQRGGLRTISTYRDEPE
jgi:hypothetical protein